MGLVGRRGDKAAALHMLGLTIAAAQTIPIRDS